MTNENDRDDFAENDRDDIPAVDLDELTQDERDELSELLDGLSGVLAEMNLSFNKYVKSLKESLDPVYEGITDALIAGGRSLAEGSDAALSKIKSNQRQMFSNVLKVATPEPKVVPVMVIVIRQAEPKSEGNEPDTVQ